MNQRVCPKHQEVLTSIYRHSFVKWSCEYLGIDRGLDYIEAHVFWDDCTII